MCLSHAFRIPPSSNSCFPLKKRKRSKQKTSPEKKQTLLNLVTLDVWQVLITMVRLSVSLDSLSGILQGRGPFVKPMILLERKTKQTKCKVYWDAFKVQKKVDKGMAQRFDFSDNSDNMKHDRLVVLIPFVSWFSLIHFKSLNHRKPQECINIQGCLHFIEISLQHEL